MVNWVKKQANEKFSTHKRKLQFNKKYFQYYCFQEFLCHIPTTFYPIKSKTVDVKSIQIPHYVFCKENTGDFFLVDIDL